MDKSFKYVVMVSTFIALLVLGGLSTFHYQVYRCINTYSEQSYQLLDKLKNNQQLSKSKIDYTQNKHTEEYYNFLKSYYETQNNWLNYWLATMGTLLTIMGLIIPYIFSRRWRDEKEEMTNIKVEFNKEITIAEEKLNRLDVNATKLEFDNLIADKKLELNEMITSATDNLWEDIDKKKEELILSIKKIIIEDIIKNGSDTEYFLDKIVDNIRDSIEKIIEEKMQGDTDYE